MLEDMALVLILIRVIGGGLPPSGVGLFASIFCYAKGFTLQSLTQLTQDINTPWGARIGEIKISPLAHLLQRHQPILAVVMVNMVDKPAEWLNRRVKPP